MCEAACILCKHDKGYKHACNLSFKRASKRVLAARLKDGRYCKRPDRVYLVAWINNDLTLEWDVPNDYIIRYTDNLFSLDCGVASVMRVNGAVKYGFRGDYVVDYDLDSHDPLVYHRLIKKINKLYKRRFGCR